MRILMVGAGATGGYFGGRMALAGRDVTFLVRGHRKEQLQRDGLRIAGPSGEAVLPQPKLITTEELKAAGAFEDRGGIPVGWDAGDQVYHNDKTSILTFGRTGIGKGAQAINPALLQTKNP